MLAITFFFAAFTCVARPSDAFAVFVSHAGAGHDGTGRWMDGEVDGDFWIIEDVRSKC
jgi:hypothetical protein